MKRSNSELTKKILLAQKKNNLKGDFFTQVKEDMENLDVTDIDILIRSDENLKIFLSTQVRLAAYAFLMEKAIGHSKVREDLYKDLASSNYFHSSKITPDLAKILFQFRTRMYDVRNNFRNKYINESLNCKLCEIDLCQQSHIYQCSFIKNEVGPVLTKYEDVFSDNIDKLHEAAKMTKVLIEKRKILLDP